MAVMQIGSRFLQWIWKDSNRNNKMKSWKEIKNLIKEDKGENKGGRGKHG